MLKQDSLPTSHPSQLGGRGLAGEGEKMFVSMLFWAVTVVAVVFVAFAVYAITVLPRIEHRKRHHRPILYVCEVNGRIGVVLRHDYNEASRKFWKRYYDGESYDHGHIMAPYGVRCEVSPVFVFRSHSREFLTLVYGCYVEEAIFEIPGFSADDSQTIREAYQYIFGKPWSGKLINW